MSENSRHNIHPLAPAAQKISQPSVPSGSGVRHIPNIRHNSTYSTSSEFTGNDAAMNGVGVGEHHPYHYPNAPGSTPRTAYPNHHKWQGYYSNHGNGDHEQQRHITSPTVAHGVQYSQTPTSWDTTRNIPRQQQQLPLQDPNYGHPHNMTTNSPYPSTPSYGRPPHHPVEPSAAPSPPDRYPSSPRTPQAIGMTQLPPTNGLSVPSALRQPSIVAAMSAPPHHHPEPLQDQRRDYHHHHRASERGFVEPAHDARYSPLPQSARLMSGAGARRPSGLDNRSHQFGSSVPPGLQGGYYNSSPLSPGNKLVGNGNSGFPRGCQYNGTLSENFRFDDSKDRAPSEVSRPVTEAPPPKKIAALQNGHTEHSRNQHHDDTDDEDDIKRETISRTASASVSPSTTRNGNAQTRQRRDSVDSTGSNGSGKEGSKKRGGPVFTDHTGKPYYEEDVVPPEIAGEVPQGWQIGQGKKCLNKLLPMVKDGLPVFPEWGLTSAGKARQRLPKACASCRTKKIKCVESEQDDAKCQHCVKMRISCSQDEEEKPARKNSKKISEKKRKKDGTLDPESGAGDSASPVIFPPNGTQGISAKKRKTSDDGPKLGSFSKRGKTSRDSSFSMEPLEDKMDSAMDSSKMVVRHQQQQTNLLTTTPVQREKRLTFATHETIVGMNVVDEGMASRSYNSRLLAEQYSGSYGGGRVLSVTDTPNSYTSASPTTSISMEHPVTYNMHTHTYTAGSKMGVTPTLTNTLPLSSIPAPIGADPRNYQLPSPIVVEHLVNVYFTYVYSQTYAFLHRQTFIETLDTQPLVLIMSLCAVAARFSEDFAKHEDAFAEPARQLIFQNYDNYCVEVVQSMVHMGLHDFGSNNGDKAWMFCGMAVRMGSALNLNLENGQAKSIIKSPIAREVARRTYWSYYLMDRFNGYGVARPFLTQDHDCHVQLPCNQPSFRDGKSVITQHLLGPNPSKPHVGDTYMGAMAFLVRAVGIWGNILKQIHLSGFDKDKDKEKEFHSLIETLETWRKTLPHGLQYSNENLAGQIKVGTAGAFVTMHVMWHTAMAYVHRYVRTVGSQKEMQNSNSSVAKENIVRSIRKTFVHADAVLQIMSHVQQRRAEAQRMGQTEVIANAPFLGQAISDACDISIIRAIELKGEPGGARDQRDRVFVGLEWLKELRRYWKPLDGMYKKLRKNCRSLERSMSQPPSGRMSNVIPSPDSGNGSELLASYRMFEFPIDPATYNLQPGIDVGDPGIPVSASMNHQTWLSVPEHLYEVAFAGGSELLLYGIAEAEGGFPNLYFDPDMVDSMREDMDMATTLAPTTGVSYQTDMQGHAILDPDPMPLLSQPFEQQMPTNHRIEPDLEDSDDDNDEDDKTNAENESTSSKRKEKSKLSMSTLYFHPSAVLDGKLAHDSSGSESSGPESRRQSEAVPKAETNPMDVLHLLVSADVDTHYVSKAVRQKDRSDLGTGRAGAMVPDDQYLVGEVNADNSKDQHMSVHN